MASQEPVKMEGTTTTTAILPCLPPFSTLPPEIHLSIFDTLDPQDLTSCVLVSKYVRSICTRYIWRTINIETRAQLQRFMVPEAQSALREQSAHVRDLNLTYREMWDIFTPSSISFANIRYLKVESSVCLTDREVLHVLTQAQEHCVITLVQQSESLSRIEICNGISIKTLMDLALASVVNVCGRYFLNAVSPQTAKLLLEYLPEQVEELAFRIYPGVRQSTQVVVQSKAPSNHHALRYLRLSGSFKESIEDVLMPFLKTCGTNLEAVYVRGIHKFFAQNDIFYSLLGTAATTTLTSNHLPSMSFSTDEEIAETVSVSSPSPSRWKIIDIRGCEHAGPQTVASIRDYSNDLEVLDVSGCGSLDSAGLQSILEKAKELKSLWTNRPQGNSDWPETPILDGVDMLRTPWATQSLEVFACAIKVKLPDYLVSVSSHREPVWRIPSTKHSRAFQRLIHQRLGKQKRLRHLRLGGGWDCNSLGSHYLCYCLEMTLASGLDELRDLQKLETLDVRQMNHKIGVAELQWMYENWLSLRSIYGLFQGDGPGQAAMKEWLADNKPGWTLKDPV